MPREGVKERDFWYTHERTNLCCYQLCKQGHRAPGSQENVPWGSEGQPSGTHGWTPWCSYIQGMFSLSHNLSVLNSDIFVPLRTHGKSFCLPKCRLKVGWVSFGISRWVAQWRPNMWWSSRPRYCQAPVDFTTPDSQAEGSFVKKNSTPEAWSWGCMLDAVFPKHLFQMTKSQRALWPWGERRRCLNAGFQS